MSNLLNRCMKYWGCSVLAVALILLNIGDYRVEVVYAADKTVVTKQQKNITKATAKELAKYQVKETMEKGKAVWDSSTTVKQVHNLYNTDKELSAYAVELKSGTEDAGYVIVGANEEHCPIIEFKTSGTFLDEKLKNDEYILYDGKMGYFRAKNGNDKVTDIRNTELTTTVDTIEKVENEEADASYEEEWEAIAKEEDLVTFAARSSTNYSGEITSPKEYESGYSYSKSNYVPSYRHVEYFKDKDLVYYEGPCAPIAATNLLKYWQERKLYWFDLRTNQNWFDTYKKLGEYFHTDESDGRGTNGGAIKDGLDNYLWDKGIQTGITHYYAYRLYEDEPTWDEMKYRIDCGDPFIFCMGNQYYYANGINSDGTAQGHTVLALGYQEFFHSTPLADGRLSSRYLCIADGWTNYADRYVNIDVGLDTTYNEMITLYFVGK